MGFSLRAKLRGTVAAVLVGAVIASCGGFAAVKTANENQITAPDSVTPDSGSVVGGTTTTIHANWQPVFVQMVSGRAQTIAIDATGTVWAWGQNSNGVIAPPADIAGQQNYNRPVKVQGLEGVKVIHVSIGTNGNAFAVDEDGTLWGWGRYMGGGFTDTSVAAPIIFPEFAGKKVVAAAMTGNSFTVSLDDASTWSWGVNVASNTNGQQGTGVAWSPTPVRVSTLDGKQIIRLQGSMDPNNAMFALDSTGGMWGWGYNSTRILGDGTSTNKSLPVQPSGFAGKKIVDFDNYHGFTVAVDEDGRVWGWGNRANAVLGDGYTGGGSYLAAPQVFPQWGDNIVAVAAGSTHTLALDADGSVYTVGANGYGQLMNGAYASQLAITQVAALSDKKALAIDAGQYTSYVMTDDGRLFAAGAGSVGQIGDGKIPLVNAVLPTEALAPELEFTRVMFDGIEGTALTNLGDAQATVVTPPHAAGPVDVQVSMTLGGTLIEPDTILTDGFTYLADVPPTGIVDPLDETVVVGESATFTAAATAAPNTGPLHVQWQVSDDDGVTWVDVPGATSASYTIASTVLGQTGERYRAVFSTVDYSASVTTNSALLTVTPVPMPPPTDVIDPEDQTVQEGQTATFTADATAAPGTGPLAVQWQRSDDGGVTWADVAGGVGTSYTTPATVMADDDARFRVRFTTIDGLTSVFTNPAKLTVLKATFLSIEVDSVGSALSVNVVDVEKLSSVKQTVRVRTNAADGYLLSVSTHTEDRSFNHEGGAGALHPGEGTVLAPGVLATGSWGFRVDGVGGFGGLTIPEKNVVGGGSFSWAGVPGALAPAAIRSASAGTCAASVLDEGACAFAETDVWYAMRVAPGTPSGHYSQTVLYTVVAN
ncbi:MAG: hypothetical protein E2601_06505 [Microbacterium sp.]|nr:hypothetical protein [Microbacterium sp.]